jgi:signal peptidase I
MRAFLLGLFSLLKLVVTVIIIAFVLRYFVMQPFVVEGQSMEPNFHHNELLIVEKISYQLRYPRRGEVIVFRFPSSPNLNYIKRIVGTPGDRVSIHDGAVYINGKRTTEPYLNGATTLAPSFTQTEETVLGDNQYFVLGDNRSHSSDSREWGVVPRVNIVGRAFWVIFPVQDFGLIPHANISFYPLPMSYWSPSLFTPSAL